MKFLADENFPIASKNYLKSEESDIIHVGEIDPGISDEQVIETANKENRIILTFDSDFRELVFKKGYKPVGVVFFKIKHFLPDFPGKLLQKLLKQVGQKFKGFFTVVEEDQVRQKKIDA